MTQAKQIVLITVEIRVSELRLIPTGNWMYSIKHFKEIYVFPEKFNKCVKCRGLNLWQTKYTNFISHLFAQLGFTRIYFFIYFYMLQLRIAAIFRELHILRHVQRCEILMGKFTLISFHNVQYYYQRIKLLKWNNIYYEGIWRWRFFYFYVLFDWISRFKCRCTRHECMCRKQQIKKPIRQVVHLVGDEACVYEDSCTENVQH